MGSTFLSLHYHVVFSTEDRRPLIRHEWRPQLHEYLDGTVRGLGGIPESVGGVEDHVHLLIGLKATHCLADFMRELKKASVFWAIDHHEPEFGWQDGYATFTISATHRESVRKYIGNQEEHHKRLSFMDELKVLLEKNGVQYDPKYLL